MEEALCPNPTSASRSSAAAGRAPASSRQNRHSRASSRLAIFRQELGKGFGFIASLYMVTYTVSKAAGFTRTNVYRIGYFFLSHFPGLHVAPAGEDQRLKTPVWTKRALQGSNLNGSV